MEDRETTIGKKSRASPAALERQNRLPGPATDSPVGDRNPSGARSPSATPVFRGSSAPPATRSSVSSRRTRCSRLRNSAAWNRQHSGVPARGQEKLPDGRVRVELDDQFADYDSLEDSCEDF